MDQKEQNIDGISGLNIVALLSLGIKCDISAVNQLGCMLLGFCFFYFHMVHKAKMTNDQAFYVPHFGHSEKCLCVLN